MAGPARILVQLLDGETVVHEYRRATTLHLEGGIQKMLEDAMGWMQSYQGQVSNEQWRADAEHVRDVQAGQ